MSSVIPPPAKSEPAGEKPISWLPLPDHMQLPCTDGSIVENFQEHPQAILLTTSIRPVLDRIHPDGQYCIGQDSGIYWAVTDPPLDGCKSPDWYYVPNVPPMIDGQIRRSYVLWKEIQSPLMAIEFVSGDGSEERDRTPRKGKFWVYEHAIHIPYYVIWDGFRDILEVYHLDDLRYRRMKPNSRGRYLIEPMSVEFGTWRGRYPNVDAVWLRFFDTNGNLLLTGEERAEQEKQRADRLAAKLRELGVRPEDL